VARRFHIRRAARAATDRSMQTDDKGYAQQRKSSAITYGNKWEAITPHDTNTLSKHYKYMICTTAGTCVMEDAAGTALTLTFVANDILPLLPTKIKVASTGTFYGVVE
jgi:hypothetical protein